MHVGVVDAVALRRFDEATMVRFVAAKMRRATEYKVKKKDVKIVVDSLAGVGARTRLTDAVFAEINRQDEVGFERITRREDAERVHYDPVYALTTSDHFRFDPEDYYRDGEEGRRALHKLDRMAGIFEQRVGGYGGFVKTLGEEFSGNVEVKDARIFAGQLVALIEPTWRSHADGTVQHHRVVRFLVVAPPTPRHKAIAVKVSPDCHKVGEALQSVAPSAVVVAVNEKLQRPRRFGQRRVELDWKRRRFIVQDGNLRRAHPFRKIGITPEGATRLKWRVIEAGGEAWLRVLTT